MMEFLIGVALLCGVALGFILGLAVSMRRPGRDEDVDYSGGL
jgi:hypothetical protein